MPTPSAYVGADIRSVFGKTVPERRSNTIELLYFTDRADRENPLDPLPYGQERAWHIAFGEARVGFSPDVDWTALAMESVRSPRSRRLRFQLTQTRELGRFPREPYDIVKRPDGTLAHDPNELAAHKRSAAAVRRVVRDRLQRSPSKRVLLYVHGFNETFATAAYTAADLCHFLGRQDVCAFFTWPAASSGNLLMSYTSTTESATYAEDHLRKVVRLLATTPGVEGVEIMAHSRGSAVVLKALKALVLETMHAGLEPAETLKINNVVLFSPDVDAELGFQAITSVFSDPDAFSAWQGARLPDALRGRLTVCASPKDRALSLSRWLFRGQGRVGALRSRDISNEEQRYLERLDAVDFVIYKGRRTDFLGHSFFLTNPMVSSDIMMLLRYGRAPDHPSRDLVRRGQIVWVLRGNED
jgi:esterase/lipase superfamily enzyme